MGSHLLNLVFLLMYTAFTNGRVELYITPSVDSSCPHDPCLTLSQFAADPSNNTGNGTNINHRLVFLSGNHTLERELSLNGADNLSMESQDNERVVIKCASQSARFVVDGTTFISFKGLHFIGCGGNMVTTVKELVVEDTTIQGVIGEGSGTALVLDKVKFARIVRSIFISNTPGANSQRYTVGEFVRDQGILNRFGLQPDDLVSPAGAILILSSNVSVTDTKFVHNTAELGGVLLAYQSNITITHCTCSDNRAHIGGVMVTIKSVVIIDSSTFTNNAAAEVDVRGVVSRTPGGGGVIDILGGSVKIISSAFIHWAK